MPRKAVQFLEQVSGKVIKMAGYVPSDRKPPNASQYVAGRYRESDLPPKVDLRPYMTAVEDQAQTNSCVANAIAGAYEYLAKRELGDAEDISRLFIYYNARQFDGIRGDRGSTIGGSIQVLHELGSCSEATWPYNPEAVNDRPPSEAFEEAQNFLIEKAEEVPVDLYAMKHCLAEGYPFVFGLLLFQSFNRAARRGRVPAPAANETRRESHGAHAMLCVGYSDSARLFIVRNSWGPDWGREGYCYIPYDYLANPEYCWDCWAVHNVTSLDFSSDVWYDTDDLEPDAFSEDDDDGFDENTFVFYYAGSENNEELDEEDEGFDGDSEEEYGEEEYQERR